MKKVNKTALLAWLAILGISVLIAYEIALALLKYIAK